MFGFLKRIFLGVVLWSIVFCSWSNVFASIKDVYVIHFVLDGLRKDVLNHFVQAGELPHLKDYFVDRGATFKQTLASFPSVSSPNYIAFATGLETANSGVFGLEWFDRTRARVMGYLTLNGFNRVNTDLLNRIALMDEKETRLRPPTTLFEKLSPEPTAAVYTPFRRGATMGVPKTVPVAGIFNAALSLDGLKLDELAMRDVFRVFSKPLQKIPRYTLVALYAADYYGHKEGVASDEVLATLKQFDFSFAQFLDQLKERGILDKTYIILSSDHGIHPTGDVFDLRNVLWKAGFRDKSVYVGNRGISSTFLYAKGEKGWKDLPSLDRLRHFPVKDKQIDLIKTILDQHETDWIAVRDGFDAVRIFKQDGQALIKVIPYSNKSFYSYSYTGKDPLGFSQDPKLAPFLKGKVFSKDQWFKATAGALSPNGVVEIANLFQEPRMGDILILAKGPWGFRKEKAGTHGSLNRDDMTIPLWIGGPAVPHKTFDLAKGVDLFPTVLEWFGFGPEEYKDQEGRPLFQTKKKNEDNVALWLAELENNFPQKKSYPPNLHGVLLERCRLEQKIRQAQLEKLERLQQEEKNGALRWSFGITAKAQAERIKKLDDVARFLSYH
ncbi:MAG: hypothetical protein A3H42_02545 [Deltaproteobacteria bacterium RIFCSPLOWO2_02_FULL_46_8]|nr:MAG: hypothetical protein A3H42_02545 [Deltaproteobacteria bacterium RIFCSPLOWO2_02_FULL_46_8]